MSLRTVWQTRARKRQNCVGREIAYSVMDSVGNHLDRIGDILGTREATRIISRSFENDGAYRLRLMTLIELRLADSGGEPEEMRHVTLSVLADVLGTQRLIAEIRGDGDRYEDNDDLYVRLAHIVNEWFINHTGMTV